MSGTIYYDKASNPVIRTLANSDKEPDRFDNPIEQVKHQVRQQKKWLHLFKFPLLPVEYYVVNANSKAIMKVSEGYREAEMRVIQASLILEKIDILKNNYSKEILPKKDLRKLANLLLKNHTPESWDIFKAFDIPLKDIFNGIRCPRCNHIPMKRVQRTWICSNVNCDHTSKDIHEIYLKYYGLLLGRKITIKEIMNFLKIECRHMAKRIIDSMKFPYEGKNKCRVYYIPEEFINDQDQKQ